jgi:hypothetical protein
MEDDIPPLLDLPNQPRHPPPYTPKKHEIPQKLTPPYRMWRIEYPPGGIVENAGYTQTGFTIDEGLAYQCIVRFGWEHFHDECFNDSLEEMRISKRHHTLDFPPSIRRIPTLPEPMEWLSYWVTPATMQLDRKAERDDATVTIGCKSDA